MSTKAASKSDEKGVKNISPKPPPRRKRSSYGSGLGETSFAGFEPIQKNNTQLEIDELKTLVMQLSQEFKEYRIKSELDFSQYKANAERELYDYKVKTNNEFAKLQNTVKNCTIDRIKQVEEEVKDYIDKEISRVVTKINNTEKKLP